MRLPSFRAKKTVDESGRPARSKVPGPGASAAPEGPVQAARTQARRRLMGALVLLGLGVVGFPILFETQPRPLPVDTPILVPEGTPVRAAPAPAPRSLPVVPADAGNETAAEASAASGPVVAAVASAPAPPAAASRPVAAAAVDVAPAPVAALPKPRAAAPPAKPQAVRPEVPRPEAAKPAKAAAETGPASAGRFVVQVGAYNDMERLRAARQNLDKLGYKSYTQDVETPAGKRTRVRVGPFNGRQEAEAVASKVKASGMQANVLSL
jgi:DedD protein